MFYIEVMFLILFVILIVIGYAKNNRNMMLVAALCLVVGTALPGFTKGVSESAAESVSEGRDSWGGLVILHNKSQQFAPAAPDTHFVRAAVLERLKGKNMITQQITAIALRILSIWLLIHLLLSLPSVALMIPSFEMFHEQEAPRWMFFGIAGAFFCTWLGRCIYYLQVSNICSD